MQAWVVTMYESAGKSQRQTLVHAVDEATARSRGASALGVPASAVYAKKYDGPTLGRAGQ